jgi:hypothetical protein
VLTADRRERDWMRLYEVATENGCHALARIFDGAAASRSARVVLAPASVEQLARALVVEGSGRGWHAGAYVAAACILWDAADGLHGDGVAVDIHAGVHG